MGSTTISGLEALEDKILRAAALIEKLQREKNEVLEENKVLKEKNDLLYISSEELKKELEIFKQDKDKDKDFDKTREEINNKIEEMLVKLESLDI